MARMVVLADKMEYGTRALRAGQTFEVSDADAYWLELIGNARLAKDKERPNLAPRVATSIDAELERWRACYLAATGKAPDKRWGLARLRQELEAGE